MENIYKKLLEIQKEIGTIKKDSINPFFKSDYFDINKLVEVLKPILNKHKLVIIQPVEVIEGKNILKTILLDTESGEQIESSALLPIDIEPQKFGSACTYLRRYCLQSMLFLQAEDDDGSKSSPKNISTTKLTKRDIGSTISKRKVIPQPQPQSNLASPF